MLKIYRRQAPNFLSIRRKPYRQGPLGPPQYKKKAEKLQNSTPFTGGPRERPV
jgi:hypothetical protein